MITGSLVVALLAACSGGVVEKPAETTTPAAVATTQVQAPAESDRNVFVYSNVTDFPDLDPSVSFSNDSVVTSNCYETLTFYNPPGSAEVLSPRLATSWESNPESTVWTFHLREGVKFQDGEPFDATAVKSAIERTQVMGLGASYIWASVESIEVVDDLTVEFTLSYPAPLDLVASSGYGSWIFSPKADEYGTDWFQAGNCAGTGPYTIESYEPGSRLVMTRNDDYWGGWSEGQFDTVVFEIDEDPTVRQQKIESGTADFTYDVPPDNLPALEARDDLVVYTNPSFQNLLGLLNTQKPPLDDPKVRQAISYTFPYDDFVANVMGERATAAHGPVPAGMWGHSDDLFRYPYDLGKAKELLAEAGYADGGFDLLLTYATGDLDEQQVAEVWKADLAKVGINLDVQAMTWEAQWALGQSDPQSAQDVFLFYWWPDYVSPISFLYSMFRSEDETLFNLGYYKNAEFDALIDKADATSGVDREAATQMFIDAQKMLVDDAAAVFLYDVANIHVARADIKGYVDNPAYPHVVFAYDLSR
ncbi:MAG: ABC transporter substrate-binding protein [Gammaproteobacteria bacterium]|nr:ABC transporter substrate-binding protein [Gammaproteobacteria bacterium]